MPIDMWSLGCILAELLTGYPLLPGEDEGDQVSTETFLARIPAFIYSSGNLIIIKIFKEIF